jgi:hypothetical protein
MIEAVPPPSASLLVQRICCFEVRRTALVTFCVPANPSMSVPAFGSTDMSGLMRRRPRGDLNQRPSGPATTERGSLQPTSEGRCSTW